MRKTLIAMVAALAAAVPSAPPVAPLPAPKEQPRRSEEHTSELQSHLNLVCRLLLEKKKHHYMPHSLMHRPRSLPVFTITRSRLYHRPSRVRLAVQRRSPPLHHHTTALPASSPTHLS